MAISRNKTRENIITSIYDNIIYNKSNIEFDIIETLKNTFNVNSLEDIDMFTKEIYLSVYKNYEKIILDVSKYLVKWKFSRLNELAQALFLECVSEVNFAKLTSKAIVINFAVDYAKTYLAYNDYKYINAVLDKVLIDNDTSTFTIQE